MKYDVIVIGSGPGGYVCAIRCAQLGLKTAIVERYNTLGGTCLNVGCIPSKALLDSSEHFYNATHNFSEHGITVDAVKADLKKMIKRKDEVVSNTISGVDYLMNKNKIDVHTGHASFTGPKTISIQKENDTKTSLEGDKIVIATGSKPITPPAFGYNKKRIITSTEALNLNKIPKSMIVIGGGVIGLELGSVYARLGTEVTVVEYLKSILPELDQDASREMTRVLKKQGFSFYLKHMVESVKSVRGGVKLEVSKRDSDEKIELKAEYCLISIGRRPYTDNLGLENTSVKLDDKGRIEVGDHLETGETGVYAIGDVVRGAMLAHKAEDEGIFVAEYIAGQRPHIDYNLIPSVVYTWPEVAGVGKTEQQLKAEGIPYNKGKFPYRALGRARASMDMDGFVKVLAHKESDEILGVHMVGARVADMIMEAVTIMEFKGSAEDMARICHPHPTYTEAIKEAALAATANRPIHM
jgi:dihydrolipoamide dehydrogenase